jgi:hypothetical protein
VLDDDGAMEKTLNQAFRRNQLGAEKARPGSPEKIWKTGPGVNP